ncbi:acetylxylan esterase [Emticicia aquatilis]|uniref:Acetylxylan esterase n=1 Tax=Emticicia aquatilis TaxID=1537369 RepID=A0A916YIG4_9BACT|nr:sialate O-acetylesterase [Emticicia aquatilis]GGD44718.1 acetylxylan esterase [Emticicia aquatilis]
MKKILYLISFFVISQTLKAQETDLERTQYFPKVIEKVTNIPSKNKVWVFIMAGQSNMAGRGQVVPSDTIPNKRILSLNKQGELIYAKEPLHFYEPTRTGLDCGVSFANRLLKQIPDDVSILLIPTAVGGSAISQWLGDSTYRDVKLLSNFKEKVAIGQKYGVVKGILWHQGESDASEKRIPFHTQNLSKLFGTFRNFIGIKNLPIILGELGSYSKTNDNWQKINQELRVYVSKDRYSTIVQTQDFKHKGDNVHFDSAGQRALGERFALAYLLKFYK